MRAISQNSSIYFKNRFSTILFLLIFLVSGCAYIQFSEKTETPSNFNVDRSYFPNGKIEYEAEFINGKLDGVSRTWRENGNLLSESQYSNGQPHGIWRQYYPNSNIMHEAFYEYGKKHGKEKWYYENGQLKSEQKFIYGDPESEITRWKPDGTLVY